MKKRFLIFLLAAGIILLAGCGGDGSGDVDNTSDTSQNDPETTEFVMPEIPDELSAFDPGFDFSAYMELGDYARAELSEAKYIPITDEYVNDIVLSTVAAGGYYEDNASAVAVQAGDVAVISFESTIDDEEYSGGSESDFAVLIGMGQFIPEVEDALIGRSVGDEFEISAEYPDDYYVTNIAGKTADFSITIEKICTVLEFSDEIAKELSEDEDMTAETFIADVRTACEISERLRVCSVLWSIVSDAASVKDVPVCDRAKYCRDIADYYREYAESLGHSYEELLESWSMTESEFLSSLYNEGSFDAAKQDMIVCAVCRREGFECELTDEDYRTEIGLVAESGGYSSIETVEKAVPKVQLEKVAFLNRTMYLLAQKLGLM